MVSVTYIMHAFNKNSMLCIVIYINVFRLTIINDYQQIQMIKEFTDIK